MTPAERLAEIENKRKSDDDVWLTSEDEQWLIDRVKKLTEALETISHKTDFNKYVSDEIAIEALDDDKHNEIMDEISDKWGVSET